MRKEGGCRSRGEGKGGWKIGMGGVRGKKRECGSGSGSGIQREGMLKRLERKWDRA